jgi:hypothetical protein
MVHPCCALILQWCRKWRCVGTSVLVCGGRRLQEFPDKEYQVPDKEYQVPRQGISGSQQGAIIFQTVKLLLCTFNLCSHMKMLNLFALKRYSCLSVTVEFIVCNSAFTSTTKHGHYKT